METLTSSVPTCTHISNWDYSSAIILIMLLFNIFLEWLLDIPKKVLSFFHGNGFLIKNYELSIILSDVLTFEAVIQDR